MKFVCESVNDVNKIRLDISDLPLDNKEKLEPFLYFNGSTYKNIKEADIDPHAFDHIFGVVNWSLARLSEEENIALAQFFVSANYTIHEYKPEQGAFIDFVEGLGQQFANVIQKTRLLQLFRQYSIEKITLQDTSEFGKRPQDTDELTFKEEEMRETMVLAMFCKLAAPIFGELINNLPETKSPDGKKQQLPKYKESKCSGFMTPLICVYFADLWNKLLVYIDHIITGLCAKVEDSAAIFHGLTASTRPGLVMSSLFVRNFVLCELEKPESNIIRYTDTLVRTLVNTQNTNAHKCQVRARKAPGSSSSDESGNMAQMEIDSLVSSSTYDGPILIEDSIDKVIDKYRAIYEISAVEFDACVEYFKRNQIYISLLNKFVACVVFGREIGGGRGVEEVDSFSYTKLIALLQLISFSKGYIELGNMLTAQKSNNVRMDVDLALDSFKRQSPTLPNYVTCRSRFSRSSESEVAADTKKNIREREWDKQMNDIMDELIQTIFVVNTPDYILDQTLEGWDKPLNEFIHNGTAIIPTTEIMEQACALINEYNSDN